MLRKDVQTFKAANQTVVFYKGNSQIRFRGVHTLVQAPGCH